MELRKHSKDKEPDISDKRVLRACQQLADTLAKGSWFKSSQRSVAFSRTHIETLGFNTELFKVDGERLRASTIGVSLSFTGDKEVLEYDGGVELEEGYIINTIVTETVAYADLPELIRDMLLDYIDEDEYAREEIRRQGSIDKALLLRRDQEVTYYIDDAGTVVDYELTCRYKVNDDELDELIYTRDEAENLTSTAFIEGEVVEWQQADLNDLTEAEIDAFMETFDMVMSQIETKETFNAVSKEEILVDRSEDSRRVLGMIAVLSADMRKTNTVVLEAKKLFYRIFPNKI